MTLFGFLECAFLYVNDKQMSTPAHTMTAAEINCPEIMKVFPPNRQTVQGDEDYLDVDKS